MIFENKQNISWSDVELFLKKYINKKYIVEETGDIIKIAGDFPDEYAESKYTKRLRGSIAKAKANAAQVIKEIISIASNRRWQENKAQKHCKDAANGWYRYDSYFASPVMGSMDKEPHLNIYRTTLVVRITSEGLFLYDLINIKKEASTPLEST